MWTIKEVDDNPTCFLIIDETDTAIASVYNRDQAAAITNRYNALYGCHKAHITKDDIVRPLMARVASTASAHENAINEMVTAFMKRQQ